MKYPEVIIMDSNPIESKETQFHHFFCGIDAQKEII